MINKRGFKRIYEGDIVEVLQGEYIGNRYFVEDYMEKSGNVFVLNPVFNNSDFLFLRGEYFLWRSPLRNKLKRIKSRFWLGIKYYM